MRPGDVVANDDEPHDAATRLVPCCDDGDRVIADGELAEPLPILVLEPSRLALDEDGVTVLRGEGHEVREPVRPCRPHHVPPAAGQERYRAVLKPYARLIVGPRHGASGGVHGSSPGGSSGGGASSGMAARAARRSARASMDAMTSVESRTRASASRIVCDAATFSSVSMRTDASPRVRSLEVSSSRPMTRDARRRRTARSRTPSSVRMAWSLVRCAGYVLYADVSRGVSSSALPGGSSTGEAGGTSSPYPGSPGRGTRSVVPASPADPADGTSSLSAGEAGSMGSSWSPGMGWDGRG